MRQRRSEEDEQSEKENVGNTVLLDRRKYLKMGAAATAAVAIGSGGASAAAERHGITFDRVVDIVDDYGADPTGSRSIDGAVTDAMSNGPGTLIEVPSGEYLLENGIDVPHRRIGFLATGDVTLQLGNDLPAYFVTGSDGFLWEGIDIDMRGGDRRAGMRLHVPNRFHVEDVEVFGRGGLTGTEFNVAVGNDDGIGVLRSITDKKGGYMDRYDNDTNNGGDGRIGVWAGYNHKGTLKAVDLDLREFGNNAMYTSRCPGKIQVSDSYFENNNVASVRISGAGSFVETSEFLIDHSQYAPEIDSTESGFNTRPIIIEQGKYMDSDDFPAKPAGCEVRNCEVTVRDTHNDRHCQAAIEQGPQARSLTITDTVISVDVDGVPAIRRGHPGWIAWRADQRTPPAPHWTRVDTVTITGGAADGAAIRLNEADGSEITNTCIHQPNGSRAGIKLVETADAVVDSVNVNVGGQAIVASESDVSTAEITKDGTCDGSTTDSGSSDEESDTSLAHDLRVMADEGADGFEYQVVIDGDAELVTSGDYAASPATNGVGEMVTDNDDGTVTVSGIVADGGGDSFRFSGSVVDATLGGSGAVYVDGSQTDSKTAEVDRTVSVVGFGNSETSYEFSVDGALVTDTRKNNTEGEDVVDDSTASGTVVNDTDGYRFSGSVTDFTLDGDAAVYVDGKQVNPDKLGTTDSAALPNKLVFDGLSGETVTYEFVVTGTVDQSPDIGSAEPDDAVDNGTVSGSVSDDVDGYRFTGDLQALDIDGAAAVTFDDTDR